MSNHHPSDALGGFEPFNDLHAINVCTVMINFELDAAQPVPPEFWTQVRKAATKLELGVGAPSYGVGVTFQQGSIDLVVNRPPQPDHPAVGVELSSVNENGRVTFRVIALTDTIVVQTLDYVRWTPFFGQVKKAVDALARAYNWERLASVQIEYADRFEQRAPGNPDIWKLLSKDSRFLTPSVLNNQGPWHCHSGHFETTAAGSRRLWKLNVDVRDNEPVRDRADARARAVLVSVTAQDRNFKKDGLTSEAVSAILDDQHSQLKLTFGDVLTDAAKKRIGLMEQ